MNKEKPTGEIIDELISRAEAWEWGISQIGKEQFIIKLKEAKYWLTDKE